MRSEQRETATLIGSDKVEGTKVYRSWEWSDRSRARMIDAYYRVPPGA
jgi:hypothetical protein